MSYLVVFVVDEMDNCTPVLRAWEKVGVTGVSILESSGLGRVHRAGLLDDLPLMPGLNNLFQNDENQNRTLFSVVETQAQVDKMVAAVQEVVGNLEDPHTGFLFVVPVSQVYGFGKHRKTRHLE